MQTERGQEAEKLLAGNLLSFNELTKEIKDEYDIIMKTYLRMNGH